MNAEPLSKDIYDKANEHGIEKILLQFFGGSDEGHLHISLVPYENHDDELHSEIEDWAWSVYQYSGAGEGVDYGDDIEYDLKNGTVNTSEWHHVVQKEETGSTKLEIEEE